MGEQARRLVVYTQNSYFQHLRLYDFVLNNLKLSVKKYVNIPLVTPQSGESLSKAMAIEDTVPIELPEEKSASKATTIENEPAANALTGVVMTAAEERQSNLVMATRSSGRGESQMSDNDIIKTSEMTGETKVVI